MESQSVEGSSPASSLDCWADNARLKALVDRLAAGDRSSLSALYELTLPTLFSFARRVLRNTADVEEVICDVYTQAWQSAVHYDPLRGTVMTWLMTICRTRAIDRYRHNQSTDCATEADGKSVIGPTCPDPAPDELLYALQQGTAIHSAIQRLSPLRRQLLALAFFQGLTHNEIAAKSKLPVGTVKSHIRRALAFLRKDLAGKALVAAREP